MEKNGEFKPEQETKIQKQFQKLIIKTAVELDQSKLGIKHNLKPKTKAR